MTRAFLLRILLLALPLVLYSSCATSQPPRSERDALHAPLAKVHPTRVSQDQLQLDFALLPPPPSGEFMSEEEAQAVLAAFARAFPEKALLQIRPVGAAPAGTPAPWEQKLRAEFLRHYGASRLSLPHSIQHSALFMALRLSPRYMGAGIRDAAQELFRSPIFLTSVALSVLVYFSAWMLPEPFFSKAFAATLTARLAFAVGLLELHRVARVCLQLYRDAQSARTMKELESAAERFGRELGGTALRILVAVASFGMARSLPNVPPGGLGALLGPPRYAMAGGLSLQSASTAHVVSDGTLVIAGAVLGTASSSVSSACAEGTEKKDGYQWHHLATDKNDRSSVRGGPWTPLFERLFAKAGMSLDAPANRVYLAGHRGPHPEAYHKEIYQRLEAALAGCRTVSQCGSYLVDQLEKVRREVCTPGSSLHRLLMQP